MEGVEALLKKKDDDTRGQTFTSRTNTSETNLNENKTMNYMNGSCYSHGFDIRTTCPNGFKKIEEIHQPALRTTSNLSHLTKYGFSSTESKYKNVANKKS